MALIVQVPQGGDIYVGHIHFEVQDVSCRGSEFRLIDLSDKIIPMVVTPYTPARFQCKGYQVAVMSGHNDFPPSKRVATLRISADKAVTIIRGDLYRKNGAKFAVCSPVREAIAQGKAPVNDILTLIHLAAAGQQMGATIRNGNLLIHVEGQTILGVELL